MRNDGKKYLKMEFIDVFFIDLELNSKSMNFMKEHLASIGGLIVVKC